MSTEELSRDVTNHIKKGGIGREGPTSNWIAGSGMRRELYVAPHICLDIVYSLYSSWKFRMSSTPRKKPYNVLYVPKRYRLVTITNLSLSIGLYTHTHTHTHIERGLLTIISSSRRCCNSPKSREREREVDTAHASSHASIIFSSILCFYTIQKLHTCYVRTHIWLALVTTNDSCQLYPWPTPGGPRRKTKRKKMVKRNHRKAPPSSFLLISF